MKLVTSLFFFSLSFFAASAQELQTVNELQITPITIEHISVPTMNASELFFTVDKKTIVRKKSYKYIIENTLSGRKNLIFKTKRSIKIC